MFAILASERLRAVPHQFRGTAWRRDEWIGPMNGQADFAVVGAGLAGLRTAASLIASGANVTVFEARERVGGRVLSAPGADRGTTGPPLVLDLGAQWVGPGQTEMLGHIRELGLHVVPTAVPGRAIWGLDGRLQEAGAALPPVPPLVLAEVLAGGALVALMSRSVPSEAPWQARRARQWDRVTAEDWIRRRLRSAAARDLARLYITGNMATEPTETSMLGVLFDLGSIKPARRLATAEAFRLHEGAHELARRLAGRLEHRIRFADPVRAIIQDSGGVTVESDAGALRCRRVAVCVPPPLASRIAYTPALPDRRARLLASLPMGASVKFHAVYQRPFWRARGLSGQAWTTTGTVGLTYDNSPRDGTGRGVLVGLVVADQARRLGALDPLAQEQEILASLEGLFGPDAAAPDALVVQDWGAEEWTGGCYAAHFPPGVWTSYGSAFRAPCGRIHWAGTETSTQWHGYMEGALRSGYRAAQEMLYADSREGAASDQEPRASLG
jgi:monoamine oxidase